MADDAETTVPHKRENGEMSRLASFQLRADTVRQLFAYLSRKRLWGMFVLLVTLLLVSVVVIFAEAFTYLAPFVYSIF